MFGGWNYARYRLWHFESIKYLYSKQSSSFLEMRRFAELLSSVCFIGVWYII